LGIETRNFTRRKLSILPLEKRLMLDASLPAVAGQVLWLDAADDTSIIDADGDDAATGLGGANDGFSGDVATWQDKSGNSNHVTQGTVSRQASYQSNVVNGNNVVRFDGIDDFLTGSIGALGSDYTVFAVGYFNQLNQGVNDFDYIASIGSGGGAIMSSISRTAKTKPLLLLGR